MAWEWWERGLRYSTLIWSVWPVWVACSNDAHGVLLFCPPPVLPAASVARCGPRACTLTLSCRKKWWGTKDSFAWEKALMTAAATSVHHVGGIDFACHPCAHLAWTSDNLSAIALPSTPRWEAMRASTTCELPRVVDFHHFNSAQRSLELPVDWARVRRIAFWLEQHPEMDGTMSICAEAPLRICCARVRSQQRPDDGEPASGSQGFELEVADVSSLEVGEHSLLPLSVRSTVHMTRRSPHRPRS